MTREIDGDKSSKIYELEESTASARVLHSRDSSAMEQGQEENEVLRSDLKEVRQRVEDLRRRLATQQKK